VLGLNNHGADHEITKAVAYKQSIFTCRAVSVSSNEADNLQHVKALSFEEYKDGDHYRFIRYDDSFERCIVKDGADNSDATKSFSLSTDDIIFALGTPVICHDKNSDFGDRIYCEETDYYTIRNLIGEDGVLRLGDVRAWNNENKCYTIHWEDESLEPSIVHRSKVIVPCRNGDDNGDIILPIGYSGAEFHTTG